ncbi:hypothetical protein ACIBSV_33910 [Embleya sp. NPDC050154]|uniref:hypothetical protein n=1 Tax=Embleya sp. NPDC050154 TaxID=3363988 RepID=UPI00379D09CB
MGASEVIASDARVPAGETGFAARTTTAMGRWERLRGTLIALGHRVSLVAGRGFRTVELDMSAFAAHGASVRSCVPELRAGR